MHAEEVQLRVGWVGLSRIWGDPHPRTHPDIVGPSTPTSWRKAMVELKRADASPTGVTLFWYNDTNIGVICPWNPDFVHEAKGLQGKWNPGRLTWTFPRNETSRVRALLFEIFYTDGSPDPGIDVLVDLDRLYPDGTPGSVIEIAGRWAASIHPDRGGCQLGPQTSLARGIVFPEDEGLGWSRGACLEVLRLPERYLAHIPEQAAGAFWVLQRHGLDLNNLRRQESAVSSKLKELRLIIEREELATPGLAAVPRQTPPDAPLWRVRCRPLPEGGEHLIVHLDGCMASQSTRVLTTEEVVDLAERGARLCPTCGAYRTARALGAPISRGRNMGHRIGDTFG
ncbi:DUF6233 domain-containing protein [Streptomyces sp. CB03911]|uniref:DUF6233 domain-containing protein n=1 Tax=Streptomyces sp. CB03911 TaxID=1804758 RepID=UPI0018FE752A|nr:DUF6233 domain-containing protein [Streptomyces sp. CB03911]